MLQANDAKIQPWIDGFSNCGAMIQTIEIKKALERFQELYPERDYVLARSRGMWFITRKVDLV